jgi:hypothetical protein
MLKWRPVLVCMFAQLFFVTTTSWCQTPQRFFRIFGGYEWVTMGSFNEKLVAEGNRPIHSTFNAGAEIAPVPQFAVKGLTVTAPLIGVDYIKANSKQTFELNGNAATVNWNVPTLGIFVAPEIVHRQWYFKPIGIGYYWLGPRLHDWLTVTDQPGARLEISDETIGSLSMVGYAIPIGDTLGFAVEGGFRYLNFTNVKLVPRGPFRDRNGNLVQPTNLPEDLNYSGLVFRAVFTVK